MAIKNQIKMSSKLFIGGVYNQGEFGELTVVGYGGCYDVDVVFSRTGHKRKASTQHILRGGVKDPFCPSVYGVGFIGSGKYTAFITEKKRSTKQYKTWMGMLERCYSENLHKKHPTYTDCFTCDEWHNFQVFAKWFDENYIEGYHLDKDIKIDGNKEYSPSTCLFVSPSDNAIKATAKATIMTNPNGERVSIYNMKKFCRDNNLNRDLMRRVSTGHAIQHKGWTK